jgi:hypothetical protein
VRAEAFYACLMDEGFPAILEDYEGDQSRVGFEAPGPDALAILVEPEGQFRQLYEPDMNLGDKDFELRLQEAAVARAEELVEAAKASPYGMVVEFDGVDRTAEYVGCLESSAYTEPEIVRDWAAEAERDRKIADVSNEWAACAREHGVLGVKDAVVARDTHPVALLPPSISPAALRQLVEDCPPFDPEIEQGYVDAMNAAENPADVEYPHQPSIGFDVPGYDNQDDGAPPSEEIATQMDELEAILYADRSAYFESVGGVG